MILLTAGHSNPHTGKTAAGLLRYCHEECVAVLDPSLAGQRAQEYLGAGGDTKFIASLAEGADANMLVIGIAPPGGKTPAAWRPFLLEAIDRGMDLMSGLHDFLSEDPELAQAAQRKGVKIIDVRKNQWKQIATRQDLNPNCLRVHTVGHDCSLGKMVVSLELTRGLQRRGRDAFFIATGQTGIMVSGDGLPLDCVVADFVSGAAEYLVKKHQHREILVIEGQGSLVHPSYSGVTLSLLHGCFPHALILCFEAGREAVRGLEHVPLPPLSEIRRQFEVMSNIHQPCQFVGVAMNGSQKTSDQARQIALHVEAELGLPVVDVIRDGADRLLDAIIDFHASDRWRSNRQ
jgi:uncharacterized NAD-dependent epimerase/dehydratase family protein